MANVVRFEDSGWEVREFNGKRCVSGTELGRKLGYTRAKPSMFNKVVVERLLKTGKLKDSDVVKERLPYKKGPLEGEKTEYWMTFDVALKVAMEVDTPAAEAVRQKVIDYLQKQVELAALPALVVESPSEETAIVAAVERAMTRHTEELSKTLSKAITENLARAVSAAVAPLVRNANGLYVDEDRRAELIYVARMIVRARAKPHRTTLTAIWDGIRESPNNRFRPGKVFSTVWLDKFDAVLKSLYELLRLTDKEEKDRVAKELAENERVAAEKAAAAQAPSNVLRPMNWIKP